MIESNDSERLGTTSDEVYVARPRQGTSGSARPGQRPLAGPPEAVPLPATRCRSLSPGGAPDLHSTCPVCGGLYQPGDAVLALNCLVLVPAAARTPPSTSRDDPIRNLVLGHHACVLPRLLTLLAGFQPETRFVKAVRAYSASEPVVPEHHHEQA